MMDESRENGLHMPLLVVLLVIVAGGAIDLALDAPVRWLSVHVIYEVSMVVAALVLAVVVWRRWQEAERFAARLEQTLEAHRAERDEWRAASAASLEALRKAIDDRLIAWGLTPAEREVAGLLLRGESHKRIASITGRSERTVRQHAVAVYDKSGLRGRAELAAFFLNDLVTTSPPGRGEA